MTSWSAARLGAATRPDCYTIVDDVSPTSFGKIRTFLPTEAAASTIESPRASVIDTQEVPS